MINDNIVFCIIDFETTGLDPVKDYPIEIGCIFTDNEFNVLDKYSEMIRIGYGYMKPFAKTWHPKFTEAAKVHKIDFDEWNEKAKYSKEIIQQLTVKSTEYKLTGKKVILLSDNIQFDYRFMVKMFQREDIDNIPFHYAGWDINLLCELTGIERPKKNKKHRALSDCDGLLETLQSIKELIK